MSGLKNKLLYSTLAVLVFLSLAFTEWFKGSPFLFYLNHDIVTQFKARFPNAQKFGNYRVSGLTSTIPFPPDSKIFLSLDLELPYLPSKLKLKLAREELFEDKSNSPNPTISYQILGSVELNLNKEDLTKFLKDDIKLDFFENYFLDRNTPKKEEIPQIKETITSLFEMDINGAKVTEIELSPSRSSSLVYSDGVGVACDKIYEVTIKYKFENEIRKIKTQYGRSGNGWLDTLQESIKHAESIEKSKT